MNRAYFEKKIEAFYIHLKRYSDFNGMFARPCEEGFNVSNELVGEFEEYCQDKRLSYIMGIIGEWRKKYSPPNAGEWVNTDDYNRDKKRLFLFFDDMENVARMVCVDDTQEHLAQTAKEMERVETCRALCFETLPMVDALSKQVDYNSAMETIRRCFENEKGATSTNRAAVEIMSDGKKPPLRMFVNTTDEDKLFPQLHMLCVEAAKERLQGDKQERAIRYLDRFIKAWKTESKQPQQPQEITDILPKKALPIIERAIEKRMIEKTATGYKWLMGLQMLSCFAREMSIKFNMGKGRIAWKPFEILFGIERGKLRLNYNDIQKTGQDPKDAHMIDELYE